MVTNDKATVTKELNEKHRRILEGLLKLPENRECADCKSRGPRWASINLGIFVCIQCSGIHRSLGVHISKVRSATLDTWLPEQVAFIQSMGNAKANSYWEAELSPNYNRVGIENFIRAKYEEKRWIPKAPKAPLMIRDETSSLVENKSTMFNNERGAEKLQTRHITHPPERRNTHKSGKSHLHVRRTSVPALPPPKSSSQIVQSPVVNSSASKTLSTSQSPSATDSSSSQKVKSEPIDLFNLLTIKDSNKDATKTSYNADDDNSWANFPSSDTEEPSRTVEQTKTPQTKDNTIAALEDLFKPFTPTNETIDQSKYQMPLQSQSTQTLSLPQPQKDTKKDIMSLFEESTMSSPFALHQQQMAALLAQKQSILMAAAAATTSPDKQACVLPQQWAEVMIPTKAASSPESTMKQVWRNANQQGPRIQHSGEVGGFLQPNVPHTQLPAGIQGFYNVGMPGLSMSCSPLLSNNLISTTVTSKVSAKSTIPVTGTLNSSSESSYDFLL